MFRSGRSARTLQRKSLKPSAAASSVSSTVESNGGDDDTGELDTTDAGSAYGSVTAGSASNAWPWCTVKWHGKAVIADMFTSSLARTGM